MIRNIAICDDCPHIRRTLAQKINEYCTDRNIPVKIVSFADGPTLLRSKTSFHTVFLDVQMEPLNGMDTAKFLRQNGFEGFLIFVTILEEYVFDSFAVDAFDYLVKPISDEKFIQTMNRWQERCELRTSENLIIRKNTGVFSLPFSDIVYCEVIDRKVYIHVSNGEQIDYYNKIEVLEKSLNDTFYRCHRSYLINLQYAVGYDGSEVLLKNGERVPISRLRLREFSTVILQYMKERRN